MPVAAIDNAALVKTQRRRIFSRLLAEAIKPHWPILFAAVICMALVAGMGAASAWLTGTVVQKIFVERRGDLLALVGGVFAGTFIVKSIASFGQDSLLAYVGQRVISDLQARLFRHLLRQDISLFQSVNSGSLVAHFTYDVSLMRSAVSNSIVGIGRDSLSVILLVAVMIYQDWRLSLITLVVAPLTAVPIQRLTRRMRRVSTNIQVEMGALTGTLSQSFQGIRIIKSFGMEEYEATRLDRIINRLFKLNFRGARFSAAVQPIVDIFGGLAVGAVIIYSGSRVVAGTTTAEAFFAFVAAVGLAYQPMRALGKVMPNLQEGLAAAERVYALLDREPMLIDRADAVELPRIAGEIRFDAVDFSYGDENRALHHASFVAAPGKVTALVGPSGAGKSTVFSLLPRFFDSDTGKILVNGFDIRDVSQSSLRDAMAVVSQDVILFDDTIMGNIRYGRPGASDEDVHAAARAAAAEGFIRDLPDGYDTVLGERGLRLSGGQRQRLAIARALLKDAPILLLDEATSALDTESERLIQTALTELMRGRTTVVIAHRLSTIRDADAIHVMRDGSVVESGTHDALLAKSGGLYARLHAMQFAGEVAA